MGYKDNAGSLKLSAAHTCKSVPVKGTSRLRNARDSREETKSIVHVQDQKHDPEFRSELQCRNIILFSPNRFL